VTDEEAQAFYDELVEWFGDSLANYEHEPIRFRHQIKLYRYYKERREL
jgi:hypothetical protein